MKITLEWRAPIALTRDRAAIFAVDLHKVPDAPGIYVFGRRWGTSFEALYVGKADRLRGRVGHQLNNLRLMTHIRDAKDGKRVLMVGTIKTRGGQQVSKCLTLAERALIRYFMSEGDDLVNVQGTLLRRHEISSENRPLRFVPGQMYLEMAR